MIPRLVLWVSVLRPYFPGDRLAALAYHGHAAQAAGTERVDIVYGMDYTGI